MGAEAKLLATLIAFLLVISNTAPAASEVPPDGGKKMLPLSVGVGGGRVGWRKINPRREGSAASVSVKNEEYLRLGLNIRSLRSGVISSPPAPRGFPPTYYKSPPPRPPTAPIDHPPPRCAPPPPYQQ